MEFLSNIRYFLTRLWEVVDNVYGRASAAFFWALSFFAPVWYPFIVVLIMIAFDLYWGIRAARKRGQFVLSEVGRRTVDKITSYMSCLAAVYLIEHIILSESTVVTSGVAALASACELWSFSASILIIHPNFPFIKLFRKQLRGEIESKSCVSLEELEKIYDEEEFDKTPWGSLRNIHRNDEKDRGNVEDKDTQRKEESQ